jgi:hypothetical protein
MAMQQEVESSMHVRLQAKINRPLLDLTGGMNARRSREMGDKA